MGLVGASVCGVSQPVLNLHLTQKTKIVVPRSPLVVVHRGFSVTTTNEKQAYKVADG